MEMCEQRKLNIQMLPKSAWQTSLRRKEDEVEMDDSWSTGDLGF